MLPETNRDSSFSNSKSAQEIGEDDWIDRHRFDLGLEIAHERVVENALEMAIELPLRYRVVPRDWNRFAELAGSRFSEHDRR